MWLLGADFAAEMLAGGLPGHTQGGGDPVPASPVRSCGRDALGEQHLVAAGAFGGFGDRAQVGEVFHLCRLWVEVVGERLEPARGWDVTPSPKPPTQQPPSRPETDIS